MQILDHAMAWSQQCGMNRKSVFDLVAARWIAGGKKLFSQKLADEHYRLFGLMVKAAGFGRGGKTGKYVPRHYLIQ